MYTYNYIHVQLAARNDKAIPANNYARPQASAQLRFMHLCVSASVVKMKYWYEPLNPTSREWRFCPVYRGLRLNGFQKSRNEEIKEKTTSTK